MEEKRNGKKVAVIIVSILVVASLAVVIIISAFYKNYDPTKYGRSHGGVNEAPKQTEQVETDVNK